jgi:phosphoglycolate phosphatase
MIAAPKALLFDLDGTLTDNYVGISRSIVYALERLDTSIPDAATLRRCVGPPLRDSFRWLLDTDDATVVEQAIGLYRERFAEIGWRENVVYDGIADALAALAAATTRIFICTSKPEVYARRIVTLFGFSEHLAGVYGVDLAGRLDDKVKLLAHLVATENLDPARAIMIGDRAHDIRAARVNGMRSAGVLWGYGSREELAAADAIVTAPAQLPHVLTAMAAETSR